MPVIHNSSYQSPFFFSNRHVQTIFPVLFRGGPRIRYDRERIATEDGDFLDIDWSCVNSTRLVIQLHGLEGDSGRIYMRGMCRALNRRQWDVVSLNFRGCSNEPNRMARAYHSGDTVDLTNVLAHVERLRKYEHLALVGFSLGGNIVLKYLGESGSEVPRQLVGAAALSVPCDLEASSEVLNRLSNRLYRRRFVNMLCGKIRAKSTLYPGLVSAEHIASISSIVDFDNFYTARIHHFKDAVDYYRQSSCKQFLKNIRVRSLLINALDDPFLSAECYPYEEARDNVNLFLEVPKHGGHLGFVSFPFGGEYWHERRVADFLSLGSG